MLIIFILFCFVIDQYWHILIFALVIFITYQLMNYDDQSAVVLGESQPWHPNLPFHYNDRWDRDAQVEGRTGQPMDEIFVFSSKVMIWNDVSLGIQDTQRPDMVMLIGLNNVRRTHFIINHENDYVNEDATLYNNDDNNIITSNIQNEPNVQLIVNENNLSQTVVDDPTYNINPMDSAEPQDDIYSSAGSNEEGQMVSSESDFDGGDDDQRNRILIIPGNILNIARDNTQLNQTNAVDKQPTTIVQSHNEAAEIEDNVNVQVEGVGQTIAPLTRPTAMLIRKSSNPFHLNGESSDESIQ